MQIKIEFYASLMQYLPPGKSRFRREVKVDDGLSLQRLIEQYHIPEKMAHIVLVNGHFVNAEDRSERNCEGIEAEIQVREQPVQGNGSEGTERARGFGREAGAQAKREELDWRSKQRWFGWIRHALKVLVSSAKVNVEPGLYTLASHHRANTGTTLGYCRSSGQGKA